MADWPEQAASRRVAAGAPGETGNAGFSPSARDNENLGACGDSNQSPHVPRRRAAFRPPGEHEVGRIAARRSGRRRRRIANHGRQPPVGLEERPQRPDGRALVVEFRNGRSAAQSDPAPPFARCSPALPRQSQPATLARTGRTSGVTASAPSCRMRRVGGELGRSRLRWTTDRHSLAKTDAAIESATLRCATSRRSASSSDSHGREAVMRHALGAARRNAVGDEKRRSRRAPEFAPRRAGGARPNSPILRLI